MRQLKIDTRTREDLLNTIMQMAPHYVPEWRFNPEDPDSATALSLIWADMFVDTLEKYNKILEQNKIAFFNALGAELKHAAGADGFLTFELQTLDVTGTYIEKGTEAFAYMPEEDSVYFTVNNGIYITPAQIQDIVSVIPTCDKLIHSWDGEDEGRITLFNKNGVDLQTHYFYIGHDQVFNVSGEGCIYIKFTTTSPGVSDRLLTAEENVRWEYLSEEGYVPFTRIAATPHGVALQLDEGAPPLFPKSLSEDGPELEFIRLTILNPEKFEFLAFDKIDIHSQNFGLLPTIVYADGIEQTGYGFYPFGERFGLFQDFYIACDEALGKSGAEIEIAFDLRFNEIEISAEMEKEINWKLVMRKRDFAKETEYRIRLKKTAWEYFNGLGWANLPVTGFEHEEMFYKGESGDAALRCRISFICPEDMSDVLVYAFEKRYIRVRILEVENAYRTKGYYMTPWIENIGFRYHYPNKDICPKALVAHSNGEIVRYEQRELKALSPVLFCEKKYDESAVYFRYDLPPSGSPVKTLFSLESESEDEHPQLSWEYYTKAGWNKLTVYDETRNFMKSGIITFIGHSDFYRLSMFGFEGYWIRCVDIKGEYCKLKPSILPVIESIHPNTVRVSNLRLREEERFSVEINEANKKCVLINTMVSQVKCFVLENPPLNEELVQKMILEGRAEAALNENGEVTGLWVLWDEVESFVYSTPGSKHYTVDRNGGVVSFGDGVYGKIPDYTQNGDGIRIVYYTNDGAKSNLEAGRIERLARTNPFISRIYNPLPTVGGFGVESVKAAVQRNAFRLSHLFRGVSAYDYEALAREASLNVRKCKCFPNTNRKEEYEEGSVTLVVLQKDYVFGSDYFLELKKRIKDFIIERNALPLTQENKFEVVPPWFIRMNVRIYCTVDLLDNVFYVQQEINSRINTFLDPVTGNFNGSGWEIGRIPNATQIINYIKSTDHVKSIEKVVITYGARLSQGFGEVDLDHVEKYKFILPENGKHEVFVTVAQ